MINSPIIVSLPQSTFDRFFGGINGYEEIMPLLQRVDPDQAYVSLAEQINAGESKILLTGWGSVPLPEGFLQDCPTIRYVCHLTGELRWLLPRQLIEEGLLVTNWGSAIADNVAEGALFLILACCRRATDVVMTMHVRYEWNLSIPAPVSLLDKRVGIHGFGAIAQQLTLLLKPFRCTISAYSPPVPDHIYSQFCVLRETSLEHLFEDNDVIVELEALTRFTEGVIGKNYLERIQPGGIFVNSGRGRVVREKDLEEIAAAGKLFIGLDVYSQEPLPSTSPLRGLSNVFLNPHQAGPTQDRLLLCARHAMANIRAYLRGEQLKNLIGITEYDRMT